MMSLWLSTRLKKPCSRPRGTHGLDRPNPVTKIRQCPHSGAYREVGDSSRKGALRQNKSGLGVAQPLYCLT